MREYLVIYERGESTWGAYSPDVPGCAAVGDTRDEVERLFKEALEMHLELLREQGLPLPEPTHESQRITVAV